MARTQPKKEAKGAGSRRVREGPDPEPLLPHGDGTWRPAVPDRVHRVLPARAAVVPHGWFCRRSPGSSLWAGPTLSPLGVGNPLPEPTVYRVNTDHPSGSRAQTRPLSGQGQIPRGRRLSWVPGTEDGTVRKVVGGDLALWGPSSRERRKLMPQRAMMQQRLAAGGRPAGEGHQRTRGGS